MRREASVPLGLEEMVGVLRTGWGLRGKAEGTSRSEPESMKGSDEMESAFKMLEWAFLGVGCLGFCRMVTGTSACEGCVGGEG